MRLLAPLALAVSALLGCGAPPPPRPPALPPDLATLLPPDAALTGTYRPEALRATLADLAARSAALDGDLRRSHAVFVQDAAFLAGLGLDPARPVWFGVRAGPTLAVRQATDDLERVQQAPDPGGEAAWIADHPLPAAWLHVAAVGTATPRADPDAALAARFGAVQALTEADDPAALAALLEAPTPEAAAAALAPLAPVRVVRLHDLELPGVVLVRRREGHVLVDYVHDEGVGDGGLFAGVRALTAAPDAAAQAAAADRVLGAPAPDELLRVHLPHGPWRDLTRGLAEMALLHALVEPPEAPASQPALRDLRARATLPERLMAPGAELFRASTLSVSRRGDRVRVAVAAPYTSRGRTLAGLRGGAAPLPHAATRGAGGFALTVAAGLSTPGAPEAPAPAWGALLDAVAPAPPQTLDVFLAESLACGFACWPALWTAVPGYARDPGRAAAAVFPEVEALGGLLGGASGASVVVRHQPAPGFAAALAYPAGAAELRARLGALAQGLETRWQAAGEGMVLLFGNDGGAVDALATAGRGALARSDALLEVSAGFAPETSTLFSGLDVVLGFDDGEMTLAADLPLRPLASP